MSIHNEREEVIPVLCLAEYVTAVLEDAPHPITANELSGIWVFWFLGFLVSRTPGLLEELDDHEFHATARKHWRGTIDSFN